MPTHHQLANALRILAIDAVQQANSGHPGMPMGMADIATVLWTQFFKHNPKNPTWFNRDRFILSNGHGSMLQYALLHLTGYDLPIEELKRFRQLHSKTPGHPEVNETPGVETTTGPLGQGFANGVGMAIAEQMLAHTFNKKGFNLVDHYTYIFTGDGCLMEGLSHEAASLAGTLKLGKLIVFWDDNKISIDGHLEGWFSENVPMRFEAYHWHVVRDVDGHDPNAVAAAIAQAKQATEKPTIICCKTKIAYGSPNFQDSSKAHGSPLGEEEIARVRKQLDWPYSPFEVPQEIYDDWNAAAKGEEAEQAWRALFARYETQYPDLASEFLRRMHGYLPESWQNDKKQWRDECLKVQKPLATRKASQHVLNQLGPILPELVGGSADLTPSNCTNWSGSVDFGPDNHGGNYIHYGVREFGMSAIMNGIAVHKGFIPYGGTFLTFSDYARNAIRMAALMRQKVIFVYTHDSIGVGEDGPTHQPIEQISSLRLIPNLNVWRPADLLETAVAWQHAIENNGPTCLLFSRQDLPQQNYAHTMVEAIERGGYIIYESSDKPDVILIATGSEVQLAIDAAQRMVDEKISVRVVSMPCPAIFLKQEQAYRDSVLSLHTKIRVAIEAGVKDYWYQFVGLEGKVIGINDFGLSAKAKDLYKYFNLTIENIVLTVRNLVTKK
jgi:transketolase